MPSRPAGATVWLTGLPGAGKTTIARTVADLVGDAGEVALLDGDELRATLSADLGFSRHDRDEHVRRVGFVAELLARHGVLALVTVIAPYAQARQAVREHHREHGSRFVEVHVATSLAECMRRDPKGLYAKARAGRLTGLTGVDDVYEQPVHPELRLDTSDMDAATAARQVLRLLPSQVAQRPGP
jgi:adenylylsulfate kinase